MFSPAVLLLIAAVTLRALFWYGQGPSSGLAFTLFAAYLLLYAGSAIFKRLGGPRWLPQACQGIYLVIQSLLVARMLVLLPFNDFCSLLFVPLSIQAVQFYRRSWGSVVILAFTVTMAVILIRGGNKFPSGLIMSLLFGGVCFLAGSYSHLIQNAKEIRLKNQDTLAELQAAHQQLQKYARQRQELAAEKERHRLANELHDSVTQNIFSMNLATQSARLLFARNDAGVEALLVRLQTLAQSVMGEIQAVANQFYPPPDARGRLVLNIQELIAYKREHEDLEVQLELKGDETLNPDVAEVLIHIIQEALNNVTKHSGVSQATVRLNLSTVPFSIEIEDCGIGFDLRSVHGMPGHFGLASMVEQAQEIGWKLAIDSQVDRGTHIRLEQESPGAHDGQSA